jgi:hypothetical protein
MELVLQAALQAAQPTFFRTFGTDLERASRQAGQMFCLILNACALGLLILSGVAENLIRLIDRLPYLPAVKYLPLLGFAQLFRVLFCATSMSISFSKRTTLLTIATAVSVGGGLVVALVTRSLLGPLAVAAGVLGWKATQFTAAKVMAHGTGCINIPLRAALPAMIATGLWAIATVFPASVPSHLRLAMAALTSTIAALGLLHGTMSFLRRAPAPASERHAEL